MNFLKNGKMLPRQGAIYSLHQIFNTLELDDSPSLGFKHKGREAVIQTSHVTNEDLLKIPGMASSCWRYVRTTNEWIPVFEFDGADITNLVDIEAEFDYDSSKTKDFWVTPKGFPREQFYAPKGLRSENNNIFVFSSYWKTWSRILQEGTEHNNFEFIEVNVTPVNPDRPESWQRQIVPVKIRKHGTQRSKLDKFVGVLPQEVVREIHKHVPPEIQQVVLHYDLLPRINWEKYREHSRLGGGANYELIRR